MQEMLPNYYQTQPVQIRTRILIIQRCCWVGRISISFTCTRHNSIQFSISHHAMLKMIMVHQVRMLPRYMQVGC